MVGESCCNLPRTYCIVGAQTSSHLIPAGIPSAHPFIQQVLFGGMLSEEAQHHLHPVELVPVSSMQVDGGERMGNQTCRGAYPSCCAVLLLVNTRWTH